MLKTFLAIGPLVILLSFTVKGNAQAMPTAVAKGGLQVGVGWSYVEPDYGQKAIQGVTVFGDFDFLPHIGVEAEYHYVSLVTPTDIGENSFIGGPRFVLSRGRLSYYAKALVGIGDINIQETEDNPQGGAGTYLAYGVGAGVDYRLTKHIVARGDFEYQHWSYLTGLTPSSITVGAAYRFR